MTIMLPSFDWRAASLADVLPSSLAALRGEDNRLGLPEARRVVVVLVDGLGAEALRERSGHARRLSSATGEDILASFPTTTASGIGSLCTGETPGRHGFTGYQVLDAANDRVAGLLSGWDALMVPEEWQPLPTAFERSTAQGVASYAIGRAKFHASGFTRALLRGATYVDAEKPVDRFAAAVDILGRDQQSLSYLYVAELDIIAHAKGWRSHEWTDALEEVDSGLALLERALGPDDAVLVTADHGIIDVNRDHQLVYDAIPQLVRDVRHRFGEPRCLQLTLDPMGSRTPDELADAWRDHEGSRAWVATRAEAIDAGWFGPVVDDRVLSRIGDVIIAAREPVAYFETGSRALDMVGQHGSLTNAEKAVPLARFGAFRA